MRDRLDQRFRLLVGPRRGVAHHHTLRHAVAWSYDLLDDAEMELLTRCSVFAGSFDLESACAVAGSDHLDEYTALDLLDALVRKSLLIAERASGRTRYSMLETIRQFAEEHLVARGEAAEARNAHARYFGRARSRHHGPMGQPPTAGGVRLVHRRAGQPARRPRSRPSTSWRRTASWPDSPRPPSVTARPDKRFSTVAMARYRAASKASTDMHMRISVSLRGRLLGSRAQLARGRDTHFARRMLVIALVITNRGNEAKAATDGLIEAAEATRNPRTLAFALRLRGRLPQRRPQPRA